MTAMIVGKQRNEANGSPCSPEFLSQFTAYFGTYRVDVERGLIFHFVATSLNGSNASGELVRSFQVEKGMLFLSFTRLRDGVEVTSRLVWNRISPP